MLRRVSTRKSAGSVFPSEQLLCIRTEMTRNGKVVTRHGGAAAVMSTRATTICGSSVATAMMHFARTASRSSGTLVALRTMSCIAMTAKSSMATAIGKLFLVTISLVSGRQSSLDIGGSKEDTGKLLEYL
uniref:Uncharacterized protein n=1 Tax=Tetraselmis sp. GSL018 TaxID=582737 RepID=A0A061S811_9CHLO